MRALLLLLTGLLLLCALPGQSQHYLDKARQRSYLTKVFRLTEDQTRQLYEHGMQAARPEFFTQVVDSFCTDTPRYRRLPLGYYLQAHTEGAQLVYALRAETDREVLVVDNQTDLTLVVRDSLGRVLPDAQVAVAGQPLLFDAPTQTYRQAQGGQAGLVAVTQDGRTTFHPLGQTFPETGPTRRFTGGSWLKQAGRRVLYGAPLGYLSRHVWWLVRDLKHASQVSTRLVGLLRSPFNELVREERQDRRRERDRSTHDGGRWNNYVATSQPRYRPSGDTLRLKARVLRLHDGRAYRRPLTLWLGGDDYGEGGGKRIATLRPIRPGSYQYTLPLTDSLGLRPNTYVGFRLKDRYNQTLVSGQFQLEDYELGSNHYTLRIAEKIQAVGQPQAIFVKGTDANDLTLLDARVELSLRPASAPGPLRQRQLFVPDLLWTKSQPLDALGETRIDVPATALPDADFSYQVQATLLTSDNERHTESATVDLRQNPGELHLELRADSVYLEYRQLGRSQPHQAMLNIATSRAVGSSWLFRGPVQLPYALPVSAQASAYFISDAQGHSANLRIYEYDASLSLVSDRPNDSLLLAVANPRRLPFWYFVYQGQRLRYRGYSPDLRLALPHAGRESWYVSLHYTWGGQLRTAEYTIALPAPQLVVSTEQPAVAYPGQKISLRFAVRDERGRPVPNADLTSYAYNGKFGQPAAPALPQGRPGRPVQGRQSLRRFQLSDRFGIAPTAQLLGWPRWRRALGLDSLAFYHFLYPDDGFFHEYRPAPGGITQVAAFVVDSGRVQPPIAVYVDGQPGYIYDVNQGDPYTVVADSGHHTLSIRTATRLITLHDVYLRHLHKLTLSIDLHHPCRELVVEKAPLNLTSSELLGLRRSLVVLDHNLVPAATLRQGTALRPLGRTRTGSLISGPFRPDSVLLRDAYGLRRRFMFEPLYRYLFGRNLLKMQCLSEEELGTLNGTANFSVQLPLAGFAYTEADFRRRPAWVAARAPDYLGAVLDEHSTTFAGQGRLELRRPAGSSPEHQQLPASQFVLLTRPGQPRYLRLARCYGSIQALAPGRYRVAVLLADSSCLAPAEDVVIQANGQTYFQLRLTDRLPYGQLSRRIIHLLKLRCPRPVPTTGVASAEARREIRVSMPGHPLPGWQAVRGRVIDWATNEGLPGVTVLLKGTTMGTATGADGSFTLPVPPDGRAVLLISSVGYVAQELPLHEQRVVQVQLKTDVRQLNEVVVTALGIERTRRSLGYSTSTVVAGPILQNSLRGKVPGVNVIGSVPGASSRITIRGNSSLPAGGKPLIMVDGLPFDGLLTDLDPATIASTNILKGAAAVGLYGSLGANGVVVITTKKMANPDGAGRDPRLALRRHFRDYAWWRPLLVTDARGEARTEVVLPDDVTSWDAFVLASDDHGRLGSTTGHLRAFKQLRAELATPRFLVAGDRTQLLGKTLNYGFDTAQVVTTFRQGTSELRQQARRVGPVAVDTLTFTAPATAAPDSVQLSFSLAQPNGYQDGEQRSLPLLPAGTREHLGTFATILAPDTTVQLPINPALGPVTVHLESDALPVLLAEIEHLQNYVYLCNEQAASKLKALLLEQRIRLAQQLPFRGEKAVNTLIKKLLDGRHQPEGLWGTWPESEVSAWATTHVVEALLEAEKAGFTVAFDRTLVQAFLLRQLDEQLSEAATEAALKGQLRPGYYHSPDDLIRLLALLHRLGAPADYRTYLARFDRLQTGRQPFDRYLALVTLRQQLGLPFQLDTLRRYRLRTQLGGVFYADTLHGSAYYRYLLRDRVGSTLLAYRALRSIGASPTELARMRAALLNLREGGHWASTYESAEILETIGPDLFPAGAPKVLAQARFSGALSQTVTQFPFTATLPATAGPLTLHKQGALPLYATAYQSSWNPAPAAVSKSFTVSTTLAGQRGGRVVLRAGQPAELLVTVDVKAEARYVLLEVPIPAGCSYGDPARPHYLEVHREYLRQQTGIFLDRLPMGRHVFRLNLQPRYRGSYTVNPAKAELVYFPTQFGRSASKRAVVE